MRENSGDADARTETRDPTLQDREGGGPGVQPKGDQTEGAPFDLGHDRAPGEKQSPSDRGRGEIAGDDSSPLDVSQA